MGNGNIELELPRQTQLQLYSSQITTEAAGRRGGFIKVGVAVYSFHVHQIPFG